MRTPELDLTPSDLTIQFRRDSYRLIQLTWEVGSRDFSGFANPVLRLLPKDGATVTSVTGSYPTTVRMQFAPEAAMWTALEGVYEGEYQIDYLDGAGEFVVEVSGEFTVEDSLP